MYQGWESEPRTLFCFCHHTREYRERYLGYNLSIALTDGNYSDCPNCGVWWPVSDLLAYQSAIKAEIEGGPVK